MYIIENGSATLTKCLSQFGVFSVPKTVGFNGTEYNVIKIARWAFCNSWVLQCVDIPLGVTDVESEAFCDCWFLKITIEGAR